MKKLSLLFLLILMCEFSYSQIVNGRFTTTIYSFEKFDAVQSSNVYWRAFQTFQFDITKNRYSIHSLLQGNTNISGDVNEVSYLKFYNLYFKIRNVFNIADLNLGRQYVFGGIANGSIDGGALKLSFFDKKFIIKTFAGANVNPDLKLKLTSNLKNNYTLGFHLIGNPLDNLNLSISYLNRHRERISYRAMRADTIGLAYSQLVSYHSSAEQFASADIDYSYLNYGRIYARYDYDLNFEQTSRIQLGTKINITNKIALTGDYIKRTPRLYFNSIFYVFQTNNNEEIEAGLQYSYTPTLKIFAKLANIIYSGDKANRYSLGMSSEYGSLFYSGSTGYSGELSSVSAQIFYPLLERKLIPTISVSRSSYKLTKNSNRYESFAGVFGVAVNMIKYFSFDVQLHWLSNRVYKDDLRFFVKANYFFSHKFNIL